MELTLRETEHFFVEEEKVLKNNLREMDQFMEKDNFKNKYQ